MYNQGIRKDELTNFCRTCGLAVTYSGTMSKNLPRFGSYFVKSVKIFEYEFDFAPHYLFTAGDLISTQRF